MPLEGNIEESKELTSSDQKIVGRPKGRPTSFTPEHIDKVKEIVGRGYCAHAQIAAAIGVSRRTLWRWSKEYPELEQALEEAKTKGESKLIDTLWQIGVGNLKGNPAALAMIGNNVYGWRSGSTNDGGGNTYNIQNNVSLTYNQIENELQKYLDLMGVKNLTELQSTITDGDLLDQEESTQ